MAAVLVARYDELLFVFNAPSFTVWHRSPYRGLLLVACVVLPLVLGYLRRRTDDRSFVPARMAGVFGIMCLIGVAFGTGTVKLGLTSEFTRWYLIFPQAALMLSALCALACYARSGDRGAGVALGHLAAAALATLVTGIDLVHIARTYRAAPTTRSDLTNMRDVLSGAAPCFLITQSRTVAGELHTVQEYRPLEYAEILTGCRILNGSFVQRGILDGRATAGLPTAAALVTLPPDAAIFLIVPAQIEAEYHAAVPGLEFERRQTQIGALPVWRVHPAPNPR